MYALLPPVIRLCILQCIHRTLRLINVFNACSLFVIFYLLLGNQPYLCAFYTRLTNLYCTFSTLMYNAKTKHLELE